MARLPWTQLQLLWSLVLRYSLAGSSTSVVSKWWHEIGPLPSNIWPTRCIWESDLKGLKNKINKKLPAITKNDNSIKSFKYLFIQMYIFISFTTSFVLLCAAQMSHDQNSRPINRSLRKKENCLCHIVIFSVMRFIVRPYFTHSRKRPLVSYWIRVSLSWHRRFWMPSCLWWNRTSSRSQTSPSRAQVSGSPGWVTLPCWWK